MRECGSGFVRSSSLAFATATVLIALILLLLQQLLVRRAMILQTVEQGSAIARAIEATAGYYVIFGLTDDLKTIVSKLAQNQSVEYAEFLDGSGKIAGVVEAGACRRSLVNRPLTAEEGVLRRRRTSRLHGRVLRDERGRPGKPKGYFRLLLNESQAQSALGLALDLEPRHHRARAGAGQRTGLVRLAVHRAADPGAGDDRAADRQGRSHAARGSRLGRRDRKPGRSVQRHGRGPREDGQESHPVADEAQIGRRDRGQPLAPRHRPRRRAARRHRRDVQLHRSAQQRRAQDHRQRRGALRVVRGDVVFDAGDGGLDGGGQPSHRHALHVRRRHGLGDASDGLVDQRGRSERRLSDELRHRHVGVDGGDVGVDRRRSRPTRRARTTSPWPWPTPRSRG